MDKNAFDLVDNIRANFMKAGEELHVLPGGKINSKSRKHIYVRTSNDFR
jgi:hypothetical protein